MVLQQTSKRLSWYSSRLSPPPVDPNTCQLEPAVFADDGPSESASKYRDDDGVWPKEMREGSGAMKPRCRGEVPRGDAEG